MTVKHGLYSSSRGTTKLLAIYPHFTCAVIAADYVTEKKKIVQFEETLNGCPYRFGLACLSEMWFISAVGVC